MLRRLHDRLWRALAGADGVRPGLPCNELLAPVPLAAIVVVAANDWWWKPRGVLPAWATGKLSDLAGAIALPLVVTAALDLGLRGAARLGLRVDWTLRRWKLALGCALTIVAMAATKLSAEVADAVARTMGEGARIVADPSDLIALPLVGVAWWHGRRTIARVPYGRLAWRAARGVAPAVALADCARAGADPEAVAALVAALEGGDDAAIAAAVARLRA